MPNGREPGSEHYEYKLAWLAALRDVVVAGPEAAVVCGDVNIAPADEDVFDPEAYAGQTHVTAPERAALAELQALGLRDVVRDRWPGERVFTYWDYRAGMFHRDLGMRIDLVLAGAPIAARVRAAWVDRQARKGKGPSDHAPVIVDLDEAPDGDIGPVVPPPSAPVTKRGRSSCRSRPSCTVASWPSGTTCGGSPWPCPRPASALHTETSPGGSGTRSSSGNAPSAPRKQATSASARHQARSWRSESRT